MSGTSPASGGVPDAQAESGTGACCGATARQFTKVSEGSLAVTVADGVTQEQARSADIDGSSYRQVALLQSYSGTCASGDASAFFRLESSSADQTGAGAGVLGQGGAFLVPAPIARVVATVYRQGRGACSGAAHYPIVGIK